MRYIFLWIACVCLIACDGDKDPMEVDRDLEQIKVDTLRVAIANGPFSQKQKRKVVGGLEHTLLSDFAKENKIMIRFVHCDSLHNSIKLLRNGEVDIIAGGLSAYTVRDQKLRASCSFNSTSAVLVSQRPDPWYGRYWGHRGYPARKGLEKPQLDTLHSSTWQRVNTERITENINLHDVEQSPKRLLESVALGKISNALLSSTFANTHARQFPHLDMGRTVAADVDMVFALRNGSVSLSETLNAYLGNTSSWAKVDALVSAYAEPDLRRSTGAFSHPHHNGAEHISAFDAAFKQAGKENGFDWKFLAALAFKESRFDTSAASNKGALGIMQLVPSTAEAMDIDSSLGAAGEILAAGRYLKSLSRMFQKKVPDKHERLGFILAAYNAGPGHVLDAQRLAREHGLDPSKWKGHTERALLLLSDPHHYRQEAIKHGYCRGYSIFLFVREVLHYHGHYRSVGFK